MNRSKNRKLQRGYKRKFDLSPSKGMTYVNGYKQRRKPTKGAFGGKKK